MDERGDAAAFLHVELKLVALVLRHHRPEDDRCLGAHGRAIGKRLHRHHRLLGLQRMRVRNRHVNALVQPGIMFQRIPGGRQLLAQRFLALQPGQGDKRLHADASAGHAAFAVLLGKAEIGDHANIGRRQRPTDAHYVRPVQGDLLVEFVIGRAGNGILGNAQLRALADRRAGKQQEGRGQCEELAQTHHQPGSVGYSTTSQPFQIVNRSCAMQTIPDGSRLQHHGDIVAEALQKKRPASLRAVLMPKSGSGATSWRRAC
jgi:hypothetical protein